MLGITFVCGAPCSDLQVAKLKKNGYKVKDVVAHLITTKFGNKMFMLKDGKTIIV